jgi:membrane protease YdiL (CAAX protease family)
LESFFAVLVEEVVYRAYLISRLHFVLGMRRGWSVVVAAAVFAISHRYPPFSSLMIFAFGLVFGGAYLGSRSLPRLVVGHWLYLLAVMSYYLHAH